MVPEIFFSGNFILNFFNPEVISGEYRGGNFSSVEFSGKFYGVGV